MRRRGLGLAALAAIAISILVPGNHSHAAADRSVQVTLPSFAVSLNGHMVENEYREYPLLVYRDITYFPMTWYDSRLLGLEASWSAADGLNIEQNQAAASTYEPYASKTRNAASYTAKAPASMVTINGETINNAAEPYPLLSFRNVTYFPLTWRFAHDEFGWDYHWDGAAGLSITSHNPQLQTIGLPADAAENDVALFKGYYYFTETKDLSNYIYRAPAGQPASKEEVYSYSFGDSDWHTTAVTFQIREDALWFTYHLGGGVMGSDQFVKIDEAGKAELQHQGYLDFRNTPYGTLTISLGAAAYEGENLYLTPPEQGDSSRKRIGEEGVNYGVHESFNGDIRSISPDSSTTVAGDDVYMLASSGRSRLNHIVRINLATNKSETIVGTSVSGFRIVGDKLFYVKDNDKRLYSAALDGTGELQLSDYAVSWFDSIDGKVYYTSQNEKDSYELYHALLAEQDELVPTGPVTEVRVLNNQIICRNGEALTVLDGSGNLLISLADPISRVLTSDEGLLLEEARHSAIVFVE